jgi:hypothetical protein
MGINHRSYGPPERATRARRRRQNRPSQTSNGSLSASWWRSQFWFRSCRAARDILSQLDKQPLAIVLGQRSAIVRFRGHSERRPGHGARTGQRAPFHSVTMAWWRKSPEEMVEAIRERGRSKVGRMARLKGAVESATPRLGALA